MHSQDQKKEHKFNRRSALQFGAKALLAGSATIGAGSYAASAAENPYADPEKPALPKTDMSVTKGNTAVVITDPQIDFLSPKGVTWKVVGKSVERNNTVANIRRLFEGGQGG